MNVNVIRKLHLSVLLITVFYQTLAYGFIDHHNQQRVNDYNSDEIITKTQYKLRTVQTGSAVVPNRGTVPRVSPDLSQTKTYLAKYDTTISSKKRSPLKSTTVQSVCVKCPPEKTLIARRGLDGILIKPPLAISCFSHRQFSNDLYEIETLFGSRFLFILPQGRHSFIAKIRNRKSAIIEHTCLLRYKIIVRRCVRYRPRNHELNVKCSLGNIWGSVCSFQCKTGDRLSHNDPMICEDSLKWFGDEPTCIDPNAVTNLKQCILPEPPENGKFSCEIKHDRNAADNNNQISDGSVCRVHCNRHYVQSHSVFECKNGQWNSTMNAFCLRKRHQRHLVRNHNPLQIKRY